MSEQLAVGLMSGTSVDGVDAALVSIDGAGLSTNVKLIHFTNTPFEQKVKDKIFQVMSMEQSSTPLLSSLHFELGDIFADAVLQVCKEAGIDTKQLSFIGSHGQTVYHQPFAADQSVPSTLQIGEPSVIAYRTNTKVVSNFRSMDMAAGGEGAPLVPFTEFLLYRNPEAGRLLQNIGGIGNVTVLPKNCSLEDIYAFDTGPGNMIMDGLCEKLFEIPYDKNGAIAADGVVNQQVVQEWIQWEKDFFNKKPPKSTGRELFGERFILKILQQYSHLSKQDLVATATYYTAQTIANAYQAYVFPTHAIDEVIIGGGGSYNSTLINMLRKLLPERRVLIQEDLGYSSDAKEAIAFALLANETLHGQPGNVPSATGAKHPVILGSITPSPY
ncbi:anhydro-N-acetylmuramic acid kinase AnmK [Cytobacillus spongiae]|uniref:anhydro-N-acetylmuramic acid kinase AnmK n=1 Tax=Cytobacillus spongiae TaxID=2901381 RepID=UPI002277ACAF|nr:anhydro-N-acetylmuramic acid kinase AnmK [Cytobacillus spongiae]